MIVICRNTPPGSGGDLSVEFLSHGVRGVSIDPAPPGAVTTDVADLGFDADTPSEPESQSSRTTHPESRSPGSDPTVNVAAFIDFASALRTATDPDATLDALVMLPPQLDGDVERIALALRRRTESAFEFDGRSDVERATRVAHFAELPDSRRRVDSEPEFEHLETERLLIGFATESQLDDYYRSIIGTSIFDTLIWDGPSAPDDLYDHAFLMKQYAARDPRGLFGRSVIERSTGRVVGGVSWRPYSTDPRNGDVGYAFAPHAHGRGIATEAVRALVDRAFTLGAAERIEALVFVGNDASANVVRKCGFELEGVQRESVEKRGRRLDQWIYAIPRSHWSRYGSRPKNEVSGTHSAEARSDDPPANPNAR